MTKLQTIQKILTQNLDSNLKYSFNFINDNILILNIKNPQNLNDYEFFHIINDKINVNQFSFNVTIDKIDFLQIKFTV